MTVRPRPVEPPPDDSQGSRGIAVATLFYSTATAVLIGWLLVLGKNVLLPIVVAAMLTYVLVGAAQALQATSLFRRLPAWLSYLTVLVIAVLSLSLIVTIAAVNLRDIALQVPDSEGVLLEMIGTITRGIGLNTPTWDTLRSITLDRLDLPALSLNLLSALAAVTGYTVLILTYVGFMVAERGLLQRRLDRIFPDDKDRGTTRRLFDGINEQIVTYLSTKTLINVMLGVISYVLLLVLRVENAVFWAFMIALFNYIPYVGSLIGVGIVVTYLLLVHANLGWASLTLALLTSAQVYVGNWLEPRVMARSLNLSPLTVLVALVVWSSLWGLPGAIIAVPMTSIMMMVLAAFDGTRFIPILLSRDGEI